MLCLLYTCVNASGTPLYWIDGPGDYDDPDHWSFESGGSPDGQLPTDKYDVIFNDDSQLDDGHVIYIPVGSYIQNSIFVETEAEFEIHFAGYNSSNKVEMSIYSELQLQPTVSLTYADSLNNEWIFSKDGDHYINTGDNEMMEIIFQDAGATFHQQSDIKAYNEILVTGGVWNTNSHTVDARRVRFDDTDTKEFNAENSDIHCESFDSRWVYGSLIVTGNYTIYTNKFHGGATQLLQPPIEYHNIVLGELSDTPTSPIIEYNNFECRDCIIKSIIIEDTGDTKLAGKFTTTDHFEVTNFGSRIYFNSGNGRKDTVVFEGDFILPTPTSCEEERVLLSNIHSTSTTFYSDTGIEINDAQLENIHTNGSGEFIVNNCILSGSTQGWEVDEELESKVYIWNGTGSSASWNSVTNWILENGDTADCLPTLADDVIISEQSDTDININAGVHATCRNFSWTNEKDIVLDLNGTTFNASILSVAGSFTLNEHATITGQNAHQLEFTSTESNEIFNDGVHLPKVYFRGEVGTWSLNSSLSCDRIEFESGTLHTENQSVTTDNWYSKNKEEINYHFYSSHILINGLFDNPINSYINIFAGTSLIECQDLTLDLPELYDLKLNNTSTLTINSNPLKLNSLILNSTEAVTTGHDLELNTLVFETDGSLLRINPDYELILNDGIVSNTSEEEPGKLQSQSNTSNQAIVTNDNLHTCAIGFIEYQDINVEIQGIFHSPDGIDGGNNDGINYDDDPEENKRYWIGATGNWENTSNWSYLSGGCPTDDVPSANIDVIIDQNSFAASNDVITVSSDAHCKNMIFKNENYSSKIDVAENIYVQSIHLDPNCSNILTVGSVYVENTTTISAGSTLLITLELLKSKSINIDGGLLIGTNLAEIRVE